MSADWMGGEHDVALAAAFRYEAAAGLSPAAAGELFPGLEEAFSDGCCRLAATSGMHVRDDIGMPIADGSDSEAFPACVEQALTACTVDSAMLAFCVDGGAAWMRIGAARENFGETSIWVTLHLPVETRPPSLGVPQALLPVARRDRKRHADAFAFPMPTEDGRTSRALELVDARGKAAGSGEVAERPGGSFAWRAFDPTGLFFDAGSAGSADDAEERLLAALEEKGGLSVSDGLLACAKAAFDAEDELARYGFEEDHE